MRQQFVSKTEARAAALGRPGGVPQAKRIKVSPDAPQSFVRRADEESLLHIIDKHVVHAGVPAFDARLKPRLGPAAQAAVPGPFTGRRRAASSLAIPERLLAAVNNVHLNNT